MIEHAWIAVADTPPDHSEPVVYRRPHPHHPGRWRVGIAYWTVSEKWEPEAESEEGADGFTHYIPLPPPDQIVKGQKS